jgi:hypothetical protein
MRAKLSVDQVNYLNIGLMLISAAIAFLRPFELFLAMYAFLGPLHYLTEMSWLHDKGYFTRRRKDYLPLIAMSAVITVVTFGFLSAQKFVPEITFIAFGCALVFVLTDKAVPRLFAIVGILVLSTFVIRGGAFGSIFGLLLPTIIHVFLFTGLFILAGALKGRNLSGIASLVVFCGCAAAFFFVSPAGQMRHLSFDTQKAYVDFAELNYSLMTPFRRHSLDIPGNLREYNHYINDVLYNSPTAFAVMGFIAFAYTYHYLNWFSKTSVIRWHNIPRSRFIGVIAVWIASIGVYLYDYTIGLRWLFFLSLTHVLLEFPLDHRTFINVWNEARNVIAGRPQSGPLRPKAKSA